jgi:large subunit ribosomal protein L3
MVTLQNLEVVQVDEEKQLIVVKGAIPGAREGLVYISKAKKIA